MIDRPGRDHLLPASAGEDARLADLIDDIVIANHILFHEGVLDSFGHVSARSPLRDDRFFMARAMAPGIVQAGDIVELDLDGRPAGEAAASLYVERYIHCEIYRARSDVHAIVHSHSPTVIPFSVSTVPLKPIYHRAYFLGAGVPVFEIRDVAGERNNMLINDPKRGVALARTLGERNVSLMRGHGNVVVGPNIRTAVTRAIETEVNARLQMQAILLGGGVNYLSEGEAETLGSELSRTTASDNRGADRVWEALKLQVATRRQGR